MLVILFFEPEPYDAFWFSQSIFFWWSLFKGSLDMLLLCPQYILLVKSNRQGLAIFSDPQHRWAKSTPPSRHCDHKRCLQKEGRGVDHFSTGDFVLVLHLLAILDSGPQHSSGMCVCVFVCCCVNWSRWDVVVTLCDSRLWSSVTNPLVTMHAYKQTKRSNPSQSCCKAFVQIK